jgi:hypothetical protein
MAGMIGLTDTQLQVVMQAARLVPVEKRDIFLQRILLGHAAVWIRPASANYAQNEIVQPSRLFDARDLGR